MTGPLSYMLRRADGLPPGQRELQVMPRFSDKPLRWVPPVTPISLVVRLHGREVASFDEARLSAFGPVEQVSDFHCVTTWSVRDLRWSGVRLCQVIDEAVGDRSAVPAHAVASAADGQQAVFTTEDLLADDVLLATQLNGETLCRRHGAPLRLVSPRQYGYKNVKHLIAIDLVHDEPPSALGPKEHLRARVEQEERHASLPNWLVRRPYRLTIAPTALAAERGLRNSPPS